MGKPNIASRVTKHLLLIACVLMCTPNASAKLFLETDVLGDQLKLFLKSDAQIPPVEAVDIFWDFDDAVLFLAETPTFQGSLTDPRFENAACDVNCGGTFRPGAFRPGEGSIAKDSTLLKWVFNVNPNPPATTIINVEVQLDEIPQPLAPAVATLAIPEPGMTALMLAGLGLLGFWSVRRRGF